MRFPVQINDGVFVVALVFSSGISSSPVLTALILACNKAVLFKITLCSLLLLELSLRFCLSLIVVLNNCLLVFLVVVGLLGLARSNDSISNDWLNSSVVVLQFCWSFSALLNRSLLLDKIGLEKCFCDWFIDSVPVLLELCISGLLFSAARTSFSWCRKRSISSLFGVLTNLGMIGEMSLCS